MTLGNPTGPAAARDAAAGARAGAEPTVVVVGAGFGGLATVKALKKAPVRTVLLDQRNYHLFQPLIYQVSTALLDPSDVAEPVRGELRRVPNCEFRQATVEGFDLDRKVVHTEAGDVKYDVLVVAAGSRTNTFGDASVEKHAMGMKDLTDAVRLRNEVLARFEAAEWEENGEKRRRLLSFAVVGGGSTGVETAGALAELAHHVLRRDFRDLSARDVTITLLEGGPGVLGPYKPQLQEKALKHLKKLGVTVRTGVRTKEVRDDEVELTNGEVIPASITVWTAGVCGSDLAKELVATPDRGQRVKVAPGLNLLGHPDVFVVGDLASFPSLDGRPLPMLAPVATQQGKHVAYTIKRALKGQPAIQPFRYRDKGIMSTIGRGGAVVQVGPLRMSGTIAWLTWLVVHLALIVSPRAQISIVWNWAWHLVTRDRHARAVYDGGPQPPRPGQLAPPAMPAARKPSTPRTRKPKAAPEPEAAAVAEAPAAVVPGPRLEEPAAEPAPVPRRRKPRAAAKPESAAPAASAPRRPSAAARRAAAEDGAAPRVPARRTRSAAATEEVPTR